jgi:uncharacterized membrane protein
LKHRTSVPDSRNFRQKSPDVFNRPPSQPWSTRLRTPSRAYLLGFLVVILCIFFFGVVVQSGMKSRVQAMAERVFRRVPFIGSLYDLTNRFIAIFERQEGKELKNMSPAWCFLGRSG